MATDVIKFSSYRPVLSPRLNFVSANASQEISEAAPKTTLVNFGENLYRVQFPGDRPGKPTGNYYALIKRAGKQFCQPLKTKDRKLAERR
jgi:hypothetical protein